MVCNMEKAASLSAQLRSGTSKVTGEAETQLTHLPWSTVIALGKTLTVNHWLDEEGDRELWPSLLILPGKFPGHPSTLISGLHLCSEANPNHPGQWINSFPYNLYPFIKIVILTLHYYFFYVCLPEKLVHSFFLYVELCPPSSLSFFNPQLRICFLLIFFFKREKGERETSMWNSNIDWSPPKCAQPTGIKPAT